MKKDTLADFIHAWTFDERPVYQSLGLKFVDQGKVWKKIQDIGKRNLREAVVKAERFVLDDEFITRAVERASTSNVSKLLTLCDLARLPYDSILVEFSDDVKYAAQRKLGTAFDASGIQEDQKLGRAGFLFERIENSTGDAWSAIHLSDSEGSMPVWPICCMLAHPDNKMVEQILNSTYSSQFMSSAWGLLNKEDTKLDYAIHRELLQRGYAFLEPYFFRLLQKLATIIKDEHDDRRLQDQIFKSLPMLSAENSGTLRLAIAILASLNVVPTKMVRKAVSGTYTHRFRNVSRLSTTTVSIDARPGHTRTIYDRSFQAATRHNRRHEVRGHWRDIERAGINGCGHEPGDVDGNYALCKTCGHLLRWIDHHERGDEKLGWVIHDSYVIH